MGKCKKKVVIYPGTFNPITKAHMQLAQDATEFIGADNCIFLPTGNNDFKMSNIAGHKRLEMIKKCLTDLNTGHILYDVSNHEVVQEDLHISHTMRLPDKKPEDVCTYLSLCAIEKQFVSPVKIYVLLGDENALEITTWKHAEKLMSNFHFIVVPRQYDVQLLRENIKKVWGQLRNNVTVFPHDKIEISSSQVREYMETGNYKQACDLVSTNVFHHMILNLHYIPYKDKNSVLAIVYKTIDNYLDAFKEEASSHLERMIGELKFKLKESGAKGYVLGMSGGVDCSVMAALCYRGNIPLKLISIPNGASMTGAPISHAQQVAKQFNKGNLEVVDIKELILAMNVGAISCLKNDETGNQADMALANIAPRIRMTILYTVAQRMNYLVLGTSNKSEIVMGYFTKWGDGAADIEPLAPYVKSEVRILGEQLNVPTEIIQKAPSAELWNGQTDEEEMGITYQEIDTYLVLGKGSDCVKEMVIKTEKRNYHKRAVFE